MTSNKLLLRVLVLSFLIGCSGGGGGGGAAATPDAELISIDVTPSQISLLQGATGQFNAVGTYSDHSTRNITTAVTWRSSNTAVATVGINSGAVTALAEGTTVITASLEDLSAAADLTVSAVTRMDITPGNAGIGLGATQKFMAVATLSDHTTQDVSESAVWTSSSPAVAVISNNAGSRGLATSFSAGTTTITAVWNDLSVSTQLTVTPMDNVMKITVNGSLCSSSSYVNKPCVSLTICEPGTAICRTISDILLDTGSVGLRIFKSLLDGISLTPVTSGEGRLASCMQFVDGTAFWGPVHTADIILSNETASGIPIHLIDALFGSVPSSCGTPDTAPADAGLNGILGIGLFVEDCGSLCANYVNNRYYSCDDSTCTATRVPLNDQVKNPVAMLPLDNNGFIVRLPSVPNGGVVSADGILIMGIGTRSNNAVSVISNTFPTDAYGEFTTVFNGRTYRDSFMDSGSNGLFFNRSSVGSLTRCGDWYCPSSTLNLSATMEGRSVSFQIGNAITLFGTTNKVFSELGGSYATFDWGLPFFLGRNIYVGIEGKSSDLGTGPYLAY